MAEKFWPEKFWQKVLAAPRARPEPPRYPNPTLPYPEKKIEKKYPYIAIYCDIWQRMVMYGNVWQCNVWYGYIVQVQYIALAIWRYMLQCMVFLLLQSWNI